MFKKRSRKALSHVDWAISLGVFLLYLAWFFIFIKPLFGASENMDTLLDILEDGVMDEIEQDIEQVQILIPDDVSAQYAPVIIPFDYGWTAGGMSHSADFFYIDDGKLFFLANLSEARMFSMYSPHKALTFRPPSVVIADEERVSYQDFTARFDSALLESIVYDGEVRLDDFAVEVDETELSGEDTFENSTLVAKYRVSGNDVNLTSYLFAENSHVYSYIGPDDRFNHTVQIDFTTYNYTYFFVDPLQSGEVRYTIWANCYTYKSDFLDLYDGSSGLLITTDEEISMRLCSNRTTPSVRLTFDLEDEVNFNIYIHDGPVDDVLDYPLDPVVGVVETLHTVSRDKISYLRHRDYDYLKYLFDYPKDRDFNVSVESGPVSASYGAEQPLAEDVFARRVEGFLLDDDFSQERVLVTLSVW
ncbi:hypothetical protein KY362_06155 [Candidatus Woesearchaeota archaeon]|nr:hypothetical protein [Candidatus Woesearchaeota archaeon]